MLNKECRRAPRSPGLSSDVSRKRANSKGFPHVEQSPESRSPVDMNGRVPYRKPDPHQLNLVTDEDARTDLCAFCTRSVSLHFTV
jgi:hypothetical protein